MERHTYSILEPMKGYRAVLVLVGGGGYICEHNGLATGFYHCTHLLY